MRVWIGNELSALWLNVRILTVEKDFIYCTLMCVNIIAMLLCLSIGIGPEMDFLGCCFPALPI